MLADEIVKLTPERVDELIHTRTLAREGDDHQGDERRQSPRWPFPGAVEIRAVGQETREPWFGTCRDISSGGMGVTCDHAFEPDTLIEISVHLPEVSFYGHATIRYCMETETEYLLGIQFNFDE